MERFKSMLSADPQPHPVAKGLVPGDVESSGLSWQALRFDEPASLGGVCHRFSKCRLVETTTSSNLRESQFARGSGRYLRSGVLEAGSVHTALCGNDRARRIDEAPQAWGQNDDITVVTVRRKS
jgi:hypothetical protein